MERPCGEIIIGILYKVGCERVYQEKEYYIKKCKSILYMEKIGTLPFNFKAVEENL